MTRTSSYPIGILRQPWGEVERNQWRARQHRLRKYDQEVKPRIEAVGDGFERIHYGQLDYDAERYSLYAAKTRDWDPALPAALVTGGVHGYETSGVMGALEFLEHRAASYLGRVNLLVAPCVSPWGFERINRWNYDAIARTAASERAGHRAKRLSSSI